MIVISAITADPAGSVKLGEDSSRSNLRNLPRRVTRTATLDGGVVITDSGLSHGDRTLTIVAPADKTAAAALTYIHENYTLIHLATEDGFFSGAIKSLSIKNGETALSVLVKEKLS
ncbi:MAG: hypothetical protein P1P81_04405 [Desulfobulbales bacterium]|nr:hypothetical protein [Desulfobulbales bacterium]